MQIAGIQKTTLVDYPGKIAATVFARGCNFRCGFCHNPELVLPEKYNPLIDEEEIFEFFEKRKKQLQGVCITGGEPTIHKDIHNFIHKLKDMGYAVKLDTNGSSPDAIEPLIKSGDVDYFAMDIKTSPEKYAMTIFNSQLSISNNFSNDQLPNEKIDGNWKLANEKLIANIRQSIGLIINSGIDYEFRTTIVKPLHTIEDFEEIGKLIKGAKKYYIQNFVKSKHIAEHNNYESFSESELKEIKKILGKYVEEVRVR